MHHRVRALALVFTLMGLACTQVPKQSVELSTTVGRDIVQMYKSHRELALLLFQRMKNDVNKFVDEVYEPFQIQKLLHSDHEDFKRGDQNSLFAALEASINQPANADVQKSAVDAMDVFVQVVRQEVESYRAERLKPVLAQEQEVLSAIDRSYNQIIYANSIVTGHLASIVKVHEAQEELLKEFGIEGLRKEIGQKLANTSDKLAEFVDKAKKVEGTVAGMEEKIKRLTEDLDSVIKGKDAEKKQE